MLLSSLWDEIVADDMIMFSVGVMKLLICNVLLKLNSKSYHGVEEKRIIYDAIWKLVTKGIRRFSFFSLTMSRVNEKRVGENGRKRHVKISKEYFGGEELKVGTFLSTVHIRKNSWIDQIWTKFATGSEMVFFFPMHYLQKQSQQFKERTRCWPCMFWPFFSIM